MVQLFQLPALPGRLGYQQKRFNQPATITTEKLEASERGKDRHLLQTIRPGKAFVSSEFLHSRKEMV
jgi:hypothetical protein